MINTKVKLYMVFLTLLFVVRWWSINYNFIPQIEETGISILNDMASSYCGYNDIYLHGSAYTLFFLLLLNLLLPNWDIQVLTRITRTHYIRKQFGMMILASAVFTFIFISIAVICMTITVGNSALMEWGYYGAVIPMFLLTFLYYMLMGSIFFFLFVILRTKTKAMLAAYAASVIMLGLPYFVRIRWMPLTSLVVVDDILDNKFRITAALQNAIKLSGLSLFFYLFTVSVFKGKDILGENGQS